MRVIKSGVSIEHKNAIKKYIESSELLSIDEIKWNGCFPKMLLFPTNDFQLFENQFRCIASLLDKSERLFVLKTAYNGMLFDPASTVYEILSPFEFTEYDQIWLDTPTLMFPESKKWIVITDELAEGGEGIIAGEEEYIMRFHQIYRTAAHDISRFIAFFARENQRRGVSFDHVNRILNLCGAAFHAQDE